MKTPCVTQQKSTMLLLNGPNLNLLGTREPDIYGKHTLTDVESVVRNTLTKGGFALECFQSNHEGALVDWLQQRRDALFLLLNAAAFTHTSVALRDAVKLTAIPFIEIHLSNIYTREPFRHRSYFSDIALGSVAGLGIKGYAFAAEYAIYHCSKGAGQ